MLIFGANRLLQTAILSKKNQEEGIVEIGAKEEGRRGRGVEYSRREKERGGSLVSILSRSEDLQVVMHDVFGAVWRAG